MVHNLNKVLGYKSELSKFGWGFRERFYRQWLSLFLMKRAIFLLFPLLFLFPCYRKVGNKITAGITLLRNLQVSQTS